MNTVTTTSATPRPSRLARRTGLAYLGIIATGICAEFAVRGSLVVDDDPIGTVLAGPAQDALDAVERHALGYDAGLIAFGISCLVVAWMLLASNLVPRLLAWGLAATGGIYLVGSFAALFAPGASSIIEPFYAICLVAELAFAVRLVTRGLASGDTAAVRPVTVAA